MKTDIAVLGSGFSANAVVINLLEQLEPPHSVAVIGDREGFGFGVAYQTSQPCHRLNAPAGRMSLHDDRPDHFTDWLKESAPGFGPDDFVPRPIYGRYLQECLASVLAHKSNRAKVHFIDARAVACEPTPDGTHSFALSNGAVVEAAHSVFCLGATAAGLPLQARKLRADGRFIVENPWAKSWLDEVDRDEAILFVGAGLTMVDQVLSLRALGHRGRIEAISRRGKLPLAHVTPRAHPVAAGLAEGQELSDMLGYLRSAARSVDDWRSVMDGLRPVTQALWQAMSETQKRRFLRHAAPWWNIHRHRMAPDVWNEISQLVAGGSLAIRKARLLEVREIGSRIGVDVIAGRAGPIERVMVDRIVNCSGMERCAIRRIPILRNMMAKGLVRSDRLGLGIDVSDHSEILRLDGTPQPGLYATGPMTIGQFWEISAVPDIRRQVGMIASRISNRAIRAPVGGSNAKTGHRI